MDYWNPTIRPSSVPIELGGNGGVEYQSSSASHEVWQGISQKHLSGLTWMGYDAREIGQVAARSTEKQGERKAFDGSTFVVLTDLWDARCQVKAGTDPGNHHANDKRAFNLCGCWG